MYLSVPTVITDPLPTMAQLIITWDGYEKSFRQSFQALCEAERHADVTLACDGQHVKAHKIVLASCSPYFQSLFMANPCEHSTIIMHGVRFEDLKALLVFMYSGEVTVMHEQVPSLLKTAKTLQIIHLRETTLSQLDSQMMRGPQHKTRSRERPAGLGEKLLHSDATARPTDGSLDEQIVVTTDQDTDACTQIINLAMSVAEVVACEGDATDGEGSQDTLHTVGLDEISAMANYGTQVSRKKPSFVWEFFSETGKGSVKCKMCAKLLSYKDTSGSTSNMIKHLKTLHHVERTFKSPLQE